jgi:hypothetical protein
VKHGQILYAFGEEQVVLLEIREKRNLKKIVTVTSSFRTVTNFIRSKEN